MKQVKAVLALSLAACTNWRVETRPVPEALAADKPRAVRLSLRSGDRVEVYEAVIRGDSIVGFTKRRDAQRMAVATADVTRVEFLKTDVAASVLAVGITVVAVVGILGAIAVASCQSAVSG